MDLKFSCSLFGVQLVIFQNKFKLDCCGIYLRYYNNQTLSDKNIFFHMPILLVIKSRGFNVRLDKPLTPIFNKYSNVI